jgi:hypothetical protein
VRRRILVLSFHSPPDPAVGGLRWTGLSRNMAELGWKVRMLTATTNAAAVSYPDGVLVTEVPRRRTLQDRYRRWRTRKPTNQVITSPAPARSSNSARARRSLVSGLRADLADLLDFPDHGRGWILPAARATGRAISEWGPDVVVSTGPPHSVHLAAALGIGGKSIPWIVDLRDPWETPSESYDAGWKHALLQRLEARVFQRARLLVTTTPELRDALRDHFPGVPLAWLPNGVDIRELPARPDKSTGGLSITHLGSVYYNRDPGPVVRAFATFLDSHPDAARAGSVLRFVGIVEPQFRHGLEGAAAEMGVADRVEMAGPKPREQALRVLAGSSMALVLAQGQGTMVPAKIYEAIGMGLPTLVVTEAESATGREATRLGAAVHDATDETGMAATMGSVWSGRWKGGEGAPARVSYAHLAKELEQILISVCPEAAPKCS